jgi:DNA ligase D-like protein (predicted 3'-phosphoesterase)
MIKKIIVIIALFTGLGFILMSYDALRTYKKKRDFTISPEPQGSSMPSSKHPIFVIQKHNASHLHYDFRLEMNGVLKSWAVPKGPSTDPEDKRLAIETEDHPMEYATFEGTIPEGQYGAGTVVIWDSGTFNNIKEEKGELIPLTECYKNGHIEINLKGKKLKGAYALVRTKSDDNKKWLLIKMNKDVTQLKKKRHP